MGIEMIDCGDFLIGKFQVTYKQFKEFVEETGYKWEDTNQENESEPVVKVSWFDCLTFCGLYEYRLPTEEEWEYACRAGTVTKFSFGDEEDMLDEYGWSYSNSDNKLHSVGLKKPNGWGIHDMHGNVWEWCSSKYFNTGIGRVLRGGSWDDLPHVCRSAVRDLNRPGDRYLNMGFRVAKSK